MCAKLHHFFTYQYILCIEDTYVKIQVTICGTRTNTVFTKERSNNKTANITQLPVDDFSYVKYALNTNSCRVTVQTFFHIYFSTAAFFAYVIRVYVVVACILTCDQRGVAPQTYVRATITPLLVHNNNNDNTALNRTDNTGDHNNAHDNATAEAMH